VYAHVPSRPRVNPTPLMILSRLLNQNSTHHANVYCRYESTRPASPTPSTTTTACSLKTTTPPTTLTLTTTAMRMLPLMASTIFEHRGAQCLLTLGRSTSPPLDQFPMRVYSCPLCIINRLCISQYNKSQRQWNIFFFFFTLSFSEHKQTH